MQLSDIVPNVYPNQLLKKCDSGLCLFGAGFYGRNDAIHMYQAGMRRVRVLDNDEKKIHDMIEMYPLDWIIQVEDVLKWVPATANAGLLTWDIVSVDAPTNLFPWVIGSFNTIAKLANKYLVITMSSELGEEVAYFMDNPEWKLNYTMNRSLSGLVELLVFVRVSGGAS